jgi:hypothetical protein
VTLSCSVRREGVKSFRGLEACNLLTAAVTEKVCSNRKKQAGGQQVCLPHSPHVIMENMRPGKISLWYNSETARSDNDLSLYRTQCMNVCPHFLPVVLWGYKPCYKTILHPRNPTNVRKMMMTMMMLFLALASYRFVERCQHFGETPSPSSGIKWLRSEIGGNYTWLGENLRTHMV